MLESDKHVGPNQWCWIVQRNGNEQWRRIAIFLEYDNLDDCWCVYKDGDVFKAGQFSKDDLIPLHSCRGWNYIP